MSKALVFTVQESVEELKLLQKKHPSKYKQLEMLLLIVQHGPLSKDKLAALLSVSTKSVQDWRSNYINGAIAALLKENRGGPNKPSAITVTAKQALSQRLHDPKSGLRRYTEVQQWLQDEFGITMTYCAIHQYVNRNYGDKLKVNRKTHVQQSPIEQSIKNDIGRDG